MGRVIIDQSLSLDGFGAGPHVGVGHGMGDGAAVYASVRAGAPFHVIQRSGTVVVGWPLCDVGAEEPLEDGGTRRYAGRSGRKAAPTGWPRPSRPATEEAR